MTFKNKYLIYHVTTCPYLNYTKLLNNILGAGILWHGQSLPLDCRVKWFPFRHTIFLGIRESATLTDTRMNQYQTNLRLSFFQILNALNISCGKKYIWCSHTGLDVVSKFLTFCQNQFRTCGAMNTHKQFIHEVMPHPF